MRKLSGLIVVLTLLAPLAAVAAPQQDTTPLPAELSMAPMQQPTAPSGQEVNLQAVFQQASSQQPLQDIFGSGILTWVCSRSCTACGSPGGSCLPGQGQCVPYCP
jgi:hypothetical protein